VGGSLEAFCSEEHFEQFNARLALEEGGAGGDEPPVAEDGWTQGPKRVLFMRVTWPDEPTEAITMTKNENRRWVEPTGTDPAQPQSTWAHAPGAKCNVRNAGLGCGRTWRTIDLTMVYRPSKPCSWICC
jgi:hypothetical protein